MYARINALAFFLFFELLDRRFPAAGIGDARLLRPNSKSGADEQDDGNRPERPTEAESTAHLILTPASENPAKAGHHVLERVRFQLPNYQLAKSPNSRLVMESGR